jgi:hypothetical protein
LEFEKEGIRDLVEKRRDEKGVMDVDFRWGFFGSYVNNVLFVVILFSVLNFNFS